MKKLLSILLVIAMIFSMTACGGAKPENKDTGDATTPQPESKQEGEKVSSTQVGNIVERSKGVTYRDFLASTPATLNKHDTAVADANDITNFTEAGFYGAKANDAGTGFEFICELAGEFPVDVTSKYAGDATYGIPADAKEQYAYSIKLNKNAKWEDGTPITADDYIYSYLEVINPKMKNFRASELYTGQLILANAEAYFKQGLVYEDVASYKDIDKYTEDQYVTSMSEKVLFFGDKAETYYNNDSYKAKFTTADGRNIYDLYSKERYVPVTEQVKKDLIELAVNFGDNNPDAWKELCLIQVENPAVDPSAVGIKKIDDYEIEFILGAPTNDFFIKYNLTGTWLVNKDLYENNKQENGGIIKTSYGNDKDKYMAYGPYKITEYIKDKLVVLTMNENWYGWTDGKHEYLSNFEKIRYDIVPEYETQFQMFLNGQFDEVAINSGKEEYAASDYLFSSPNKYTYNLNLFCDHDILKSQESEGINKTMLSYKDFRHAMSLGINRVNFCKGMGPLDKPLSTMINEIYIADPEAGMSYRDTDYGKQVLIDVFGGTDVDAGYNVASAREYAMKAYEAAKANGDYKDGDVITLAYPTAKETERTKMIFGLIEDFVLEFLKGTPMEGKFKVETLITDAWKTKMQSGEAQINLSGGGGGVMDPYSLMNFNIKPGNTYGIHYDEIDLTIDMNGEQITKSIHGWIAEVINGEYRTAEASVRAYILSKVETATLLEYASIPYESSSVDQLLSMRMSKQLDHYIPLVYFGETYSNMTDAEWDEYVKSQNGTLDYK